MGKVCLGGGKFPVSGFSEGIGWPSWSSRSAMAPNYCLSTVNLAWLSLDLESNGKYPSTIRAKANVRVYKRAEKLPYKWG